MTTMVCDSAGSNPHLFTDAKAAREYILAGNATFTLVSKASGKRYTYRVRRAHNAALVPNKPLFASVMYGSDNTSEYAYLGTIRYGGFTHGHKSNITCDDPRTKALGWTVGNLCRDRLPENLEVWHEGRCGRCARRLTDPVSIARGLGPECAGR